MAQRLECFVFGSVHRSEVSVRWEFEVCPASTSFFPPNSNVLSDNNTYWFSIFLRQSYRLRGLMIKEMHSRTKWNESASHLRVAVEWYYGRRHPTLSSHRGREIMYTAESLPEVVPGAAVLWFLSERKPGHSPMPGARGCAHLFPLL